MRISDIADVQAQRIQEIVQAFLPQVVALTETLCRIPAPTDQEQERAAFVAAYWLERGWEPQVDALNNVVLRRPGSRQARSLMLVAHLDTVFPRGTRLETRRQGQQLVGPAIGDNCVALACLMILPALLAELEIQTPGDVLFAANVGEEGLGNLRGIRALTDRHESELGGVLALEGHMLGRVIHQAVGSKRLRVQLRGPGGHSWHAHGTPSAIHALGEIVYRIGALELPTAPRTTVNVGVIEGGTSVNTIAAQASAIVDMRSMAPEALATLDRQVQAIVTAVIRAPLEAQVEVLGERPAGSLPREHPLVQQAAGVLERLGITPELGEASTDANLPISRGMPAVCVGITRGHGAHTLTETIDIPPIRVGLEQLLHLVQLFPVAQEPKPG